MRRPRLVRLLKWSSTLLCALLAGLYAASHGWTLHYWQDSNFPACGIDIDSGTLVLSWHVNPGPAGAASGGSQIVAIKGATAKPVQHSNSGFPGVCGYSVSQSILGQGNYALIATVRQVSIPLPVPILLFAIVSTILWRRDRYIPPGHCVRCGYNLTGNTSGVCPECGSVIRMFASQAGTVSPSES